VDNRSELPIYRADSVTLFMFICIIKNIVHRLDHCTQNWFDVASIYENMLMEIKRKSPEVVEAVASSNNAGCYHSALGISQRTGVTPGDTTSVN